MVLDLKTKKKKRENLIPGLKSLKTLASDEWMRFIPPFLFFCFYVINAGRLYVYLDISLYKALKYYVSVI